MEETAVVSQNNMREDVLKKRYYRKDKAGNVIEDWEGLCWRVANTVGLNDEERQIFYNLIHSVDFLPNSPALSNAGREKFSMSACFVLPIGDSMEGIMDAAKNTALIHKMGGGTGFSFGSLRPNKEPVGSTQGVASGPCSFIRIFDVVTDVTKQGGMRRGANMGIMPVWHPDILDWIALKKSDKKLNNFNLSIGITADFVEAVRNNEEWPLTWKGEVKNIVKARADIWEPVIEGAWKNGDPGIIFLDRINRDNPTPALGEIDATNPCGEQPLLPFEACVLGSINLSRMLKSNAGDWKTPGAHQIDWDRLGKVTTLAVRFLDNIIEIQHYPIAEVEKMHKGNRKIGLGVMGWADLLIKMGIHYDSDQARTLAGKLMQFINEKSIEASQALAEEKGVFANWEGSVWAERGIKMRNATTTTIAPTGTLSIIANVSSGIEPIFAKRSLQRRADGEYWIDHPLVEQWNRTSSGVPLPPYYVDAGELSIDAHLRMQMAFQKHVQNAISKTINLPNSATKEDVERAYLMAYDIGTKGVTVYRDGSRSQQVISSEKTEQSKTKKIEGTSLVMKERPKVTNEKGVLIQTGEGDVYLHIGIDEQNVPFETFINAPFKAKYIEAIHIITILLSYLLRLGFPIKRILKKFQEVQEQYGSVSSLAGMFIRAFGMIGVNGHADKDVCPECGGYLVFEQGCVKCVEKGCGYSKC